MRCEFRRFSNVEIGGSATTGGWSRSVSRRIRAAVRRYESIWEGESKRVVITVGEGISVNEVLMLVH